MANLSFNCFWITTLPNKPKILLLYRAPRHKGWAGHTSSAVQSELLLVIVYTTYMIVTCSQSPLNVSVGILKLVFLFEPMNV